MINLDDLDKVKTQMLVGNWSDASNDFKKINCSANEFGEYIKEQPEHVAKDFAILGFYSREFKSK